LIVSESVNVFRAGPWAELHQHCFEAPNRKVAGKLFLGRKLDLHGAEVSMNKVPPGGSLPFFHSHMQNEELFVFTGGTGEMLVDDERFAVEEGTTVRVSPSGVRIIRNNSASDLFYLCIQYRQSAEQVSETSDGVRSDKPLPW
jgi:uncharacterized cupin superfamily protein